MESIRKDHPLRLFFTGLVEHAFCAEVGMCNPLLTEYLTDLLVEFTRVDRLETIRHAEGRQLPEIAAMLAAQSDGPTEGSLAQERSLYRHIGDYTLFWAGVYPEQLKRSHRVSDVLLDYVYQGRRSYDIVSGLVNEDDTPPASLFRHLSDDFEPCLYGLGLVRQGWEHGETTAGGGHGTLLL
jgi:hypothetical protein